MFRIILDLLQQLMRCLDQIAGEIIAQGSRVHERTHPRKQGGISPLENGGNMLCQQTPGIFSIQPLSWLLLAV